MSAETTQAAQAIHSGCIHQLGPLYCRLKTPGWMLAHCPCRRLQPSPQSQEPEPELMELVFEAAGNRHKQERILRSAEVLVTSSHGIWLASGSKGNVYEVRLHGSLGSCTCPDFKNRGARKKTPCKHLYAVLTSRKLFSSNALPG